MGNNLPPYTAYEVLTTLGPMTSDEPVSLEVFTAFCEKFPELIAEREASGKVIVMSPVKNASSENEGHLFGYLYSWNLLNRKPGVVHSPSGGFLLDGDEVRCGDTSWVSNERLAPYSDKPDFRKSWIPTAPEFVIEIKSDTDRISKLKRKMVDTWLANNVLLAWLIDPDEEVAYIYRQGQDEPEEVRNFETSVLTGESILPGFEFPLVELNL